MIVVRIGFFTSEKFLITKASGIETMSLDILENISKELDYKDIKNLEKSHRNLKELPQLIHMENAPLYIINFINAEYIMFFPKIPPPKIKGDLDQYRNFHLEKLSKMENIKLYIEPTKIVIRDEAQWSKIKKLLRKIADNVPEYSYLNLKSKSTLIFVDYLPPDEQLKYLRKRFTIEGHFLFSAENIFNIDLSHRKEIDSIKLNSSFAESPSTMDLTAIIFPKYLTSLTIQTRCQVQYNLLNFPETLKELYLFDSRIDVSSILEKYNLTLEVLQLKDTRTESLLGVPYAINSLKSLKILYLQGSDFIKLMPNNYKFSTEIKLEELHIDFNCFMKVDWGFPELFLFLSTKTSFDDIKSLNIAIHDKNVRDRIKSLYVHTSEFGKSLVEFENFDWDMRELNNLEQLSLYYCNIQEYLQKIKLPSSIKYLDLSGNELTAQQVHLRKLKLLLAKVSSLETLILSYNDFSGLQIMPFRILYTKGYFSQIPCLKNNLKTLNMENTLLPSLTYIKGLDNLEQLKVDKNIMVSRSMDFESKLKDDFINLKYVSVNFGTYQNKYYIFNERYEILVNYMVKNVSNNIAIKS